MKRLMILVALFSVPQLSYAGCDEVYETAYTLMDARQKSFPINVLFNKIDNIYKDDEARQSVKGLAKDAYSIPVKITNESKNAAVIDFANKWFLICEENPKTSRMSNQ